MPRHNLGSFDASHMTTDDLRDAVSATWDMDGAHAPEHVTPGLITEIVSLTSQANRDANRQMGYGATLAWGIAIGILAERHRASRALRDQIGNLQDRGVL